MLSQQVHYRQALEAYHQVRLRETNDMNDYY